MSLYNYPFDVLHEKLTIKHPKYVTLLDSLEC